jgi:hypothetical protein
MERIVPTVTLINLYVAARPPYIYFSCSVTASLQIIVCEPRGLVFMEGRLEVILFREPRGLMLTTKLGDQL